MDNNSPHTKWRCQYHIVFAPKFRRKAIYGEYKAEIGKILRELCNWKGVEIIEAHACIDHIHMYVIRIHQLSWWILIIENKDKFLF